MSNENWIKFEDEMPKLNDNIEAIFEDGKIEKLCMETDFDYAGDVVYFCLRKKSNSEKINLREAKGWRPLKSENFKTCIGCLENFYPTSDERMCKQCSGKGESPAPSHDYKTDNWTLFEDKLPELGKKIEISVEEVDEPIGCYLLVFQSEGFVLTSSITSDDRFDPYTYRKWRYKKENRPDFSKLRKGDFLVVYSKNETAGLFFVSQNAEYLRLKSINFKVDLTDFQKAILSDYSTEVPKKLIKKITRINLKEQKFEKI